MGAAKVPTVQVPAAPPPVDVFGQLLQNYQAGLRMSATRKGAASDFLMGPRAPSALAVGPPGVSGGGSTGGI